MGSLLETLAELNVRSSELPGDRLSSLRQSKLVEAPPETAIDQPAVVVISLDDVSKLKPESIDAQEEFQAEAKVQTELDSDPYQQEEIPFAEPVDPTPTPTSQPNVQQTPRPTEPTEDDVNEVPKPAKIPTSDQRQYRELVNNILLRSPSVVPATILFVAAELNHHLPATAHQVATQLAEKDLGEILLIDANQQKKTLTDQLGPQQAGLSDILVDEIDFRDAIHDTDYERLHFMPFGQQRLSDQRTTASRLAALSGQLKQQFQYICIDGGQANQLPARSWCSQCDATYMLVSLGETDRSEAKSVVTELQSYGARLLGCIVANVPGES